MNSPAKGAGKKTSAPGGAGREERSAAEAGSGSAGEAARQPSSGGKNTAEKKTTTEEKSAKQETSAKNTQEPAAKKAVRTAQTPKPAGTRKSPARRSAGTGRSGKGSGGGQRAEAKTPPGPQSTVDNGNPAGSPQARSRSSSLPSPGQGPQRTFRSAGLSEPRWDALELPDQRVQLKRYYQGARMPSPVGGFLEPLRVRTENDGSGTLILECSASSLRFVLPIPAATRGERRTIKESQADGNDPTCPRHDPSQWLNRVGPYLVCPLCGVRYGRA